MTPSMQRLLASVSTFGESHEHRNQHDLVSTPEQETGVLVAFMAAMESNVIPPDVDPSKPFGSSACRRF